MSIPTALDEAWKALNRETGWSKADTIARHRPAIEAAIRAELQELAALREALTLARRAVVRGRRGVSTVDEAREALLAYDEREEPMEPLLDRYEAAIRAEYDEWFERTAEAEQGWGKALEQLETAEATLRALREALGPVLVEADELIENDRWADGPPNSVIIRLEYAVIALRAALAAIDALREGKG